MITQLINTDSLCTYFLFIYYILYHSCVCDLSSNRDINKMKVEYNTICSRTMIDHIFVTLSYLITFYITLFIYPYAYFRKILILINTYVSFQFCLKNSFDIIFIINHWRLKNLSFKRKVYVCEKKFTAII